jgi:hypothetical protein
LAAKTKPTAAAPPPYAALIDELGDIERELAPLKQKISRAEGLRKLLRAAFADAPAADEIKAEGSRYVAVLGPRGNQTIIDYPVLVKGLTAPAFAKFATCTLAALEEHAPAELVARVTSLAATGPRALHVTAKAA